MRPILPTHSLNKDTEIVIGVVTHSGNHQAMTAKFYPWHWRLLHWNMRMVFFTNTDGGLDVPNVWWDGHSGVHSLSAVLRHARAWRFIAQRCISLPALRWYVHIDDDTVVHADRLALFLQAVESEMGNPR